MLKKNLFFILLPLLFCLISIYGVATHKNSESFNAMMHYDKDAIVALRQHLIRLDSIVKTDPVFKIGNDVTIQEKKDIREFWDSFLDVTLYIDQLSQFYDELDPTGNKTIKDEIYNINFALFLMQYRYSMSIIFELEKNPLLHKILNESVPELGLPSGTYSQMKYRFLNVIIATEFTRLSTLYLAAEKDPVLYEGIEEDKSYIWSVAKGEGPVHTVKNGLVITRDTVKSLWYSVKKRSLLFGTVKVWRHGEYLITSEQQQEMLSVLYPGDILLERREWHLSNLGIPGFWTHVALYVGDPALRKTLFDTDEIRNWVISMGEASGDFEALLQKSYPENYLKHIEGEDGEVYRIIESFAPGVSFTTMSYSSFVDSIGALRPNTSMLAKAKAVYNAFHYLGRPYDYDFDYVTDSAMVCSELVSKAYEASSDEPPVNFPFITVLGRPVIPPNDLVKTFDSEYGSDTETFSMVFFYDGNEWTSKAEQKDAAVFRETWKRPKWHIFVQE